MIGGRPNRRVPRMAVSLKYTAYLSDIYQIGRYPIGYTNLRGIPRIGIPPVWPHIGRRYPIRPRPNPTCLIYTTLSSFLKERHLPKSYLSYLSYRSYQSYTIISRWAANPMDWITTWRRTNWPRNQTIRAPYMEFRPVGI